MLDDLRARAAAAVLDVTLCRTDTVLVEGLLKRRIELNTFEDMAVRLAGVMGMRADDLAELLRLGRLIQEVWANGEQDVERES